MNDLISRQAAIDAIFGRSHEIIKARLKNLPSAQPEQKNQKTALSVQVKVDFDDMKALLEDIGNLQTYKLSEGDDMVLADIEDIECILAKHVKAKEVQPERKKGHWIRHITTGLGPKLNDTIECSECRIAFPTENMFRRSFCPNCGADMRGESE